MKTRRIRGYRLRLMLARLRRRAIRRILLRLFGFCERISRKQLSLLEIRRQALKAKAAAKEDPEAMLRASMSLLMTDLRLPLTLQGAKAETSLEDLQILSRAMIGLLQSKG